MKYLVICVAYNLLFFASIVSTEITVVAKYDDMKTSTKLFDIKQALQLSCNVSADDHQEFKVVWEKDGKKVSEISNLENRMKMSVDQGMHYLNIQSADEEDAGNFSCVVYVNSVARKSAFITAASKIKVKIPASINVVEGEKLRILCSTYGNPPPILTWVVLNESYTESKGRVQLSEDPEKKIPNAILLIEDIQKSDRGNYTCIGTSNITRKEVSYSSTIRVKDKLAALWPFLGICAEVFVLCTIIFIYEKKRNKTELEESDTDQSPEQKNTPDHGGKESNLRHRQ